MEDGANKNDSQQYITFITNGQEFASQIMAIREIRGWTETTDLPHAPSFVRGMINLRGLVLPVIDLKDKLGLGRTAVSNQNVIIVVEDGGHTTGVLVDAVSDIVTVSASDIQPAPRVVAPGAECAVHGIAVLNDRMVTILEPSRLTFSVPEPVAA